MANPIQSMRNVFDVVKAARDNNAPLSDESIQNLLLATVSDENVRKRYREFSKGYSAEELFRRDYSLLPWVKLIIPLGQEQFPETSKAVVQVPDYEITYEAGTPDNIQKILVEAKLIDGDKQTFELPKYKYNVLRQYELDSKTPLLFAIFWRKQMLWTLNTIESFSEKSSSYKISYEDACRNDVSAIFGDYTYIFRMRPYRKSKFSTSENTQNEYFHSHEEYGKALCEQISLDGKGYVDLLSLETPVLDCAFDFVEIGCFEISEKEKEITEQLKDAIYIYKLSSLILGYLMKIYCYDNSDMYCREDLVVENSFHIIDTVRRKIGGEKFYLLPYDRNSENDKLMRLQFGDCPHIFDSYLNVERKGEGRICCNHNYKYPIEIVVY